MKKLCHDLAEVGRDIKNLVAAVFCEIVADVWEYGLIIGEMTVKAYGGIKAKIDDLRSIKGIGLVREVR